MREPRVILCTGGIGSGKSCVVQAFRVFGVPSYDCDRSAKELYDRDPELLSAVVCLTGPEVIGPDGRLDRSALASRIFADPSLLTAVEALVHPAVIRDFAQWKAAQDVPLVVIESAILLEKPQLAQCFDCVVTVVAPEDVRIKRVVLRDGITPEQVRRRMDAQWDDAARAAHADYVLENNDRQALLPAIMDIIEKEKRRWKRQI